MKKIYFLLIGILLITGFLLLRSERTSIAFDKGEMDKPEMFTKYMRDITTRIGESESGYTMNYQVEELNKALKNKKNSYAKTSGLDWVSRGPANVGGRTRAIIVDPDDASLNTWFASAATGGIWKTIDGGAHWSNLSGLFSNLSVNTMAMADSNHDIIYAGTGESFPGGTYLKGNGIWKTIDRGQTWEQLSSTATNEDFSYINRLIISPNDENIVLAATESGIFKSVDGGVIWTQVYASERGVEDLVADPTDFNVLFAGENSVGVLRSTDAGENWVFSSADLESGYRHELAVSPVDHNYVYVSVSSDISSVYVSKDNGISWRKFNDEQNFLGGQGSYDNTIAAHPYNVDEVFVGGVDIWKLKFDGEEKLSELRVLDAYTDNIDFLSFINFGGGFLRGGMSTEEGVALENGDTVSVEIRFGYKISQMAHRFTVPFEATSGVPAEDYTYKDYVKVPFQVWDVTNNRQLMVSFRDQENDGEFNLYPRSGDAYGQLGREYIFVNSVAYDPLNPSADIAQSGGHKYKNLYMFWTVLADGKTWDPDKIATSKIVVEVGSTKIQDGVKSIIADSYGNYDGDNGYDQGLGYGETEIPGIHPDHHNIVLIPTGNGNFKWIDGNDGGIAVSNDNGLTLDQIPTNYVTTQFYGVAKNPNANEYIGGMQDNGTWQSQAGVNPSDTSKYLFRLGGDGFECLWNASDPQKLLGSIYNNAIYKSLDGGNSWTGVSGIANDDGPFITRLSASAENPDMVFAVGGTGIYKSLDFGATWTSKTISTNWSSNETSTSSHNVEVSIANGNIVWAGAAMAKASGLQMQVSTNEGESFVPVDDYDLVDMSAYISGIATHPTEDSTAYLLFSLPGTPKVLRTTNLGESWEDISGFGVGNVSTNGFPDVVTQSLLVMPYNPNIIWVGTDIGLFESTDAGESWHYADSGLPSVSVYDMQISGNQVVVATHGRGIWTVDIPEIDNSPRILTFSQTLAYDLNLLSDLKVVYDSVQIFVDNQLYTQLELNAVGKTNTQVTVDKDGTHVAYLMGYIGGEAYRSNTIDVNFHYDPVGIWTNEKSENKFTIYPNPSKSDFTLELSDSEIGSYTLEIVDMQGKRVFKEEKQNSGSERVFTNLSRGTYIVRIIAGEKLLTKKIQIVE